MIFGQGRRWSCTGRTIILYWYSAVHVRAGSMWVEGELVFVAHRCVWVCWVAALDHLPKKHSAHQNRYCNLDQ